MTTIWNATHKHHTKKNNKSSIAQLVNWAGALQLGDNSVLKYASKLSLIYNELDHYTPIHNSVDREYVLTDRVYRLLQGLRSELEGIRSQLYNTENSLSFDDAVSELTCEEGRLQEMKGGK